MRLNISNKRLSDRTMALAITFPMNITIGFPIYYSIIQ
ncbi:MAG: sodium-dependent bicarbonate transport family permease [Crocinitomicaceae bacterium]|nr:sodium-dependent bicarbonate transport family permease [Crocinitomicaceae bacterium]